MVNFTSAEKWMILAHEDEYPELCRQLKEKNKFYFSNNEVRSDENVMG